MGGLTVLDKPPAPRYDFEMLKADTGWLYLHFKVRSFIFFGRFLEGVAVGPIVAAVYSKQRVGGSFTADKSFSSERACICSGVRTCVSLLSALFFCCITLVWALRTYSA